MDFVTLQKVGEATTGWVYQFRNLYAEESCKC